MVEKDKWKKKALKTFYKYLLHSELIIKQKEQYVSRMMVFF